MLTKLNVARRLKVAGLLSAVLALSACAHQPKAKLNYQAFAKPPIRSMQFFRLHSWQSIDDRQLIVETTPKKAYLLTLFSPCRELDFAITIGLTSFGNTVSAGFDRVVVQNDPSCRIKTIQPLDLKLMNAARKAARAEKS
jgi:Family of unknown function (DUF6491)